MAHQNDIAAGGDVAGGNITKHTNIYGHQRSRLEGLIEQLKEQIGEDKSAAQFVENLMSWISPAGGQIKRDLSTKLTDCGKCHLIPDAMEAKELFAKQLKRASFNPAIQEIYAYILGQVHSVFTYKIRPLIAHEVAPGSIESKIADLASDITNQVADAPPELGIGMPEVIGMLYYLTGTCRIEWDYNDNVSPSN